MTDTDGIELTLHIAAPPAVVYRYFSDPERFYSYRRDGETGRLLSFVHLAGLQT